MFGFDHGKKDTIPLPFDYAREQSFDEAAKTAAAEALLASSYRANKEQFTETVRHHQQSRWLDE